MDGDKIAIINMPVMTRPQPLPEVRKTVLHMAFDHLCFKSQKYGLILIGDIHNRLKRSYTILWMLVVKPILPNPLRRHGGSTCDE